MDQISKYFIQAQDFFIINFHNFFLFDFLFFIIDLLFQNFTLIFVNSSSLSLHFDYFQIFNPLALPEAEIKI